MANAKRKPLIAGNWKLHNNHFEAIALVQKMAFSLNGADFDAAEVVVLPPFTSLRSVQTLVDGDKLKIGYGAQDISQHEKGAYTGEVSGPMLAKLGCSYVLAGHSERREHHNEDDAVVNAKVKAAFANDITPLLCLGEGLEVRKAGDQVAHTVAQLDGALKGVTEEQARRLVIAYEPVWAIGTGEVATPDDAQEVCAALRVRLGELYSPEASRETRILYGGSVKSDNIAGIMAKSDVDGALVGGASLKADEFVKLVRFREQS
ncbi:triosephosphate isomerase [Spinactinospora alkalitolerans]|uniref:Triosephosphate isomerase n=1 Tax=Spinactinospora alkalitolerans TaxID=687207 RepID=A0A852TSW4_9ACTN|nr:triose-phosphate isomerase [Spinactinospora alkalitolerans]NYE46615.1 triosephosphate isomerase [Spinactinospora alkalitolerans]